MPSLTNKKAIHRALLDWYATAQRPLPWRTEPSLYRTVVSELMAQQTQIKTMLPYFERWMRRFPDFEALAKAPAEDVLKHWEGLGYYSRARNLHKLAQKGGGCLWPRWAVITAAGFHAQGLAIFEPERA